MKIVPEKSSLPRLLTLPVFQVAVLGLGLARWYPDQAYRLAYCPLREITGIPCLTCGGTHSIVALMAGQYLESLYANPLVFFGICLFMIWLIYVCLASGFPVFRISLEWTEMEIKILKTILILAFASSWIWVFMQFN